MPEELYNKGVISNSQEGLEAAKRIGFPVMLKASEGGTFHELELKWQNVLFVPSVPNQ